MQLCEILIYRTVSKSDEDFWKYTQILFTRISKVLPSLRKFSQKLQLNNAVKWTPNLPNITQIRRRLLKIYANIKYAFR